MNHRVTDIKFQVEELISLGCIRVMTLERFATVIVDLELYDRRILVP